MIAFDVYGTARVGQIDQVEMEKYFGQAEFWLGSKTAHVVRVVTFGYINPRKMVAEEVQKCGQCQQPRQQHALVDRDPDLPAVGLRPVAVDDVRLGVQLTERLSALATIAVRRLRTITASL